MKGNIRKCRASNVVTSVVSTSSRRLSPGCEITCVTHGHAAAYLVTWLAKIGYLALACVWKRALAARRSAAAAVTSPASAPPALRRPAQVMARINQQRDA